MSECKTNEFSPSSTVDQIDQAMQEAIASGLFMETASPQGYAGRTVRVGQDELRNFGSCSYLGLEKRQELRIGAEDALREIGTQFSFSRGYLQSYLYLELESNLNSITQGHALVVPTTTLGHISTLPVVVGPRDHVIIDQYAHASLQLASSLLQGITCRPLRHGRLHQLRELVRKASASHDRVWYICDGLYSMLGDFVDLQRLVDLLEEFPKLHLYVDDAHSTSWRGAHGRGYALDRLAGHPRAIVALSLNKAFAAAGGAIVFPSLELYLKVRRCGGPMLFSGPIQPPLLGAAVACSRLHLDPAFAALQASELERIRAVLRGADDLDVPFGSYDETPIFFVPCGPESVAFELVRSLRARGFYTCASVFPAVPRNRAGIRFTVSLHNELEDIRDFLGVLANEVGRLGIRSSDLRQRNRGLKNAS